MEQVNVAVRNVVVIGNGMVGQRFVDELRTADTDNQWHITVLGEEPVIAYDRVALSTLFDGSDLSDLSLADADELLAAGVDVRLGTRADEVDRNAREVITSNGERLPYDQLVLATGSAPFVPPIPGREQRGCFVYRTVEDLHSIRSWAAQPGVEVGSVIGGGLLGLEAANALKNLGLETHVIEMAERLMPQQLDGPASQALRRWVSELGVHTHLGFGTERIDGSVGTVTSLHGTDGTELPTQMVVFSAGIRPRHQLAEAAGLELGERGGVVIDDYCRTSDHDIAAIGEVASHSGRVHGLVAPGYAMARTLARALTGGDSPVELGETPTRLKLLGVDVATFGAPVGDPEHAERYEFTDPAAGVHRRVSVVDGVIRGGVCVGDLSKFDILAPLLGTTAADAPLAALISPDYVGGVAVDVELPPTALLCSCNGVTRGEALEAVESGVHALGELVTCTRAGTGCGGCKPDLKALLLAELERLGVSADRSLCEHFAHTRQELFDLIRFHRHSSWSAVLGQHGHGRGCEVCRPAVASILASLSNGHILDGDQSSLQDTNDHALANMQRNGTYSVVPRVPGGEITPVQLIELGQIALDFDLYSKITGAQRIDLFGAQLHELPEIWKRVVAAGLESGHAYGKALRTVKSCVGDTWCRYGVQDSVSMAIRLEKRYRGLRAPHKLKSAVSGCTRECAEVQSKDFGLIATESGWNMYLCGNGGRTPRHADLFASDLTDEEAITYMDRFLMFYIRTAEPLQRTAPWFQTLEGGMDYLRSVIVDDALEICEELEADMRRHVDAYECEWTATLNNPERMEHFVEFVNVPDQHSTPVWISERSQRVPAPAAAR